MTRWAAALIACMLVGALAPAASAQEAVPEVTLHAARKTITAGDRVRLYGRATPAVDGEKVRIVDVTSGDVVRQVSPNAEGRYSVRVGPWENRRFVAQWVTAVSEPLRIRVRARLSVWMERVALFDRVEVSGALAPRHKGERVRVTLRRNGTPVVSKRPRLREGRGFRTRFAIRKPGTYTAKVRFDDEDHAPSRDVSRAKTTALPQLSVGSSGFHVELLERRLRRLGYYLPGADRSYDVKTRDAVIAFNKVQGRVRTGTVYESTWRALVSPRKAQARYSSPRRHIEIDQTQQVVKVVVRGKVKWVLHTSTGRNGYTHDGTYSVYRKIAGYSGGRLYYPSYFDGRRAIHGWPEVPTYPASHGCARVPMWSAQWIHGIADMGMRIYVYH